MMKTSQAMNNLIFNYFVVTKVTKLFMNIDKWYFVFRKANVAQF